MTKVVLSSGKRKTAIARARIKQGTGIIRVNGKTVEAITPDFSRMKIQEALMIIGEDQINKVDVSVKVEGGGFVSQAEAVRIALTRGILNWSKQTTLRSRVVDYDRTFIAGEPRRKESKKAGARGARAKRQKSYR
ncbi:MAG: 30S ribosomal protein S9 [Candidatus Ranarchaeia archaeon]|jgi:small subunit ribosomal protein S9